MRDVILGLCPRDYDIATFDPPDEVAREIARLAGGRPARIGKPGKEVFRVVTGKNTYDVSAARGRCIADDLEKRDFTINAIAFDIAAELIIDPQNGRKDLTGGIIRMVSGEAFADDPLRLLRAFRIAAMLDFRIEPATLTAIDKAAATIQSVAGERVRDEWLKLLGTPKCYTHFQTMNSKGLLCAIFPELMLLKDLIAGAFGRIDLFSRALELVKNIEDMLHQNDPPLLTNRTNREILHHSSNISLIKHAALFCHLKPAMHALDGSVGIPYPEARMTQAISDRLRMSNHEKNFVDLLIRNHMQPRFLYTAKEKNRLKETAVTRFFLKTAPLSPDVILLSIANWAGRENHDQDSGFFTFATKLIHNYFTNFVSRSKMPSLITGNDLIKHFGLHPSPLFSELLGRVEIQRLSGFVSTRDEAFSTIKKVLDGKKRS